MIDRDIKLWDHYFDNETLNKILEAFEEAFAHSSLSCEKAMENYKREKFELKKLSNKEINTFKALPKYQKLYVNNYLFQCVKFLIDNNALISLEDRKNPAKVEELYNGYFEKLKHGIYTCLSFNNNEFDGPKTFNNIKEYFILYYKTICDLKSVEEQKKGHLEAFKYALSIDIEHLTPAQIIKINSLVNNYSDEETKNSFRTSNNCIMGAKFNTIDKRDVPEHINDILIKYQKQNIITHQDEYMSEEERLECRYETCKKIAEFHVDFERTHPFDDGNGRTGRIILNTMLIQNGLAPILITSEMRKDYFEYIEKKDYSNFAKTILTSSSQMHTLFTSLEREYKKIPQEDINSIKKNKSDY